MSQGYNQDSSSGQQQQSSPFYHMYNNYNPQHQDQKKYHPSVTGDASPFQQPPPPPPYSPSYSSTGSEPSAPPLLDQQNPYNASSYPPPSPHKDNNNNSAYLPQGYLYGATPQYSQAAPPPSAPPTNNQPNIVNWPWITVPQPPMIPAGSQRPEKSKSLCQFLTKCFIYCLGLILVIDFFKMVWWGGGRSCVNGVVWQRLPEKITTDNDLRVSTLGGHLSSGNIRILETNDEYPVGTILSTIRVSPKSILENKDLDYTLTDNLNETHLQIHLPNQYNNRYCIHLEATIYVPKRLNALTLNVQNTAIYTENEQLLVDKVTFTTTNAKIDIGSEWQGDRLALTSSNGRISLAGPALGDNSVTIKTSNAQIDTKRVTAAETIQLTTTNGAIHAQHLGSPIVKTKTSNARVNLDSLEAKKAEVISSNGFIEVSGSKIGESIQVKTSNSGTNIRIDEGKQILTDVRTSNAEAKLTMPIDFEGSLEIKTSNHNKVQVEDPLTWTHVRNLAKGYIFAERYESEETQGVGHVQLQSSNANIQLHFEANESE